MLKPGILAASPYQPPRREFVCLSAFEAHLTSPAVVKRARSSGACPLAAMLSERGEGASACAGCAVRRGICRARLGRGRRPAWLARTVGDRCALGSHPTVLRRRHGAAGVFRRPAVDARRDRRGARPRFRRRHAALSDFRADREQPRTPANAAIIRGWRAAVTSCRHFRSALYAQQHGVPLGDTPKGAARGLKWELSLWPLEE